MRHLLLLFVRAPAGGSCVSLRLIPRESLILPSRGANLLQGRGAGGCGSLRPIPGKALFLRRGAQTLHPEKPPAAVGVCAPLPGKPYSSVEGRKPFTREEPPPAAGVCASLPGKPYSSVEGRKPCTRKRCRRLCEFAPNSPERLILPLRGANPAPENPPGAFSEGIRRTPRRRKRRTAGCSRR